MVRIKSSPGVSNVWLHLRMTKVNTFRVATCLCGVQAVPSPSLREVNFPDLFCSRTFYFFNLLTTLSSMIMKVSSLSLSLHISEKKWSLHETNSYREEFRLTFHCQLILLLSKSFQQRKHCYLSGKGQRYWHIYMLTNLNNLIPKFCKINLKHANIQEFSSFFNDKIILKNQAETTL